MHEELDDPIKETRELILGDEWILARWKRSRNYVRARDNESKCARQTTTRGNMVVIL